MSEPPKTWLACAGRPGSTPVLDGGQRRHLQPRPNPNPHPHPNPNPYPPTPDQVHAKEQVAELEVQAGSFESFDELKGLVINAVPQVPR